MATTPKKTVEYPLSREAAERFRTMDSLEGDRGRKPDKNHLANLKVQIKKVCLPFEWACAEVGPERKIIRLNGAHSSTITVDLMNEGYQFPKTAVVHETTWECDTLEDAQAIYTVYDSKYSTRTNGQIASTFAKTNEEVRHRRWPKSVVQKFSVALSFADHHDYANYIGYCHDKLQLIPAHISECDTVYKMAYGENKLAKMQNTIPIGVMIETLRVDPGRWAEFWAPICEISAGGLLPGDPRLTIKAWIMNAGPCTNSGERVDTASRIILAWNKFIRGESLAHSKASARLPDIEGALV